MKSTNITIKDIAKLLGISPSTVSRALKDHPDISKSTKEQVKKLAKELNYKPNPIALSLKSQKSNVIGVIIPQIVHYFFSSVISGIEKVASDHGYSVMISQSDEKYERELEVCSTFRNSIVDGVLISISKETEDFTHLQMFKEDAIPMVFFDRMIEDFDTDSVIIDDYEGAFAATQSLIVEGRRRIIHFAGPKSRLIGRKRLKGYMDAHKKNGVVLDESLIVYCDEFEEALIKTQEIIDSGVNFDAFFAVNDFTAAGIIKVLARNNIRVPEDVSVVGFGNDHIATMVVPPLTTVSQPGFDMGVKAMQMLIDRINRIDSPIRTEILPSKIIYRNSTKPK